MTDDADITAAFWSHLRSDQTVMLGLEDTAPTSLRPMTAQLDGDGDHGPIWFFSSTGAGLVMQATAEDLAIFTFVSKGHDVFATVHGHLTRVTDPAIIDRLCTPSIAAWYKGGKDDPSLALLRFDPARAEIWRDGSSLLDGLKLMFGSDPQSDAKDNVAKVNLS